MINIIIKFCFNWIEFHSRTPTFATKLGYLTVAIIYKKKIRENDSKAEDKSCAIMKTHVEQSQGFITIFFSSLHIDTIF